MATNWSRCLVCGQAGPSVIMMGPHWSKDATWCLGLSRIFQEGPVPSVDPIRALAKRLTHRRPASESMGPDLSWERIWDILDTAERNLDWPRPAYRVPGIYPNANME